MDYNKLVIKGRPTFVLALGTEKRRSAPVLTVRGAPEEGLGLWTEPHMTTIRKLADALGVEPRDLVEA